MINIQVHGVQGCYWEQRQSLSEPKILVIRTLEGEQRISLFPVRPKLEAEPQPTQVG